MNTPSPAAVREAKQYLAWVNSAPNKAERNLKIRMIVGPEVYKQLKSKL